MKQDEKIFVDKLSKLFEKNFIVRRECKSKCGTSRIDLVLQIRNTEVFFGVECKIPNKKRGEEIGRYIKQAERYTNMEFDVLKNKMFRKIPIFICPPLSYEYFLMNEFSENLDLKSNLFQHQKNDNSFSLWHQDRHTKYNKHHSFNGLLGAFNIGEVRKLFNNCYHFSLSNKVIYTSEKNYHSGELKGLHVENYKKLKM